MAETVVGADEFAWMIVSYAQIGKDVAALIRQDRAAVRRAALEDALALASVSDQLISTEAAIRALLAREKADG